MEIQHSPDAELMAELATLRRRVAELEQAVQQHKSLYAMVRMMCDNVPDLIWAKDLDRKFLFVNKAMSTMLLNAVDTEEPIGKTDMFFAERERQAHPDDPGWHTFGEICVDSDAIVVANKQPQRFEEFGNVKGELLYLDVYKAPFWDEQGQMIGTVGCGRVVTREKKIAQEREQAIQALQQRLTMEELVTTISSRFINVPLAAVDREIHRALQATGRFTGVDRCYIHLFAADGTTIEDCYEWHVTGLVPRADKIEGVSLEPFQWMLEKLRLLETIYVPCINDLPAEAYYERETWQAQSVRSILAIPLAVNHALVGLFGLEIEGKSQKKTWSEEDVSLLRLMAEVFVSLLARKQAEAVLAEREKFIQNVANASPNFLYVHSHIENRTIYANHDMGEILGYTPDELLAANNKLIPDLVHPDDLAKLPAHLQALEESPPGEIIELEYRMRHKNLGWRWLYKRELVFKRTPAGKIAQILGTTQDITARKETEEALRWYAKRLQVLHEIDRSILATRSPKTIAEAALQQIRDLIPYQWASIVEFNHKGSATKLLATHWEDTREHDNVWMQRLAEVIDSTGLRPGQARVVQDILALAQQTPLEMLLYDMAMRAYVTVPFTVQNAVTGFLILGSTGSHAFSSTALDFVEEVATSLALAIQHARLDEQTRQDAQTKTVLLQEVNHRVKNNLASIIGLLHLEQRRIGTQEMAAPYQKTMNNLINRVQGLATVHRMLSVAEWSPVPLSELTYQMINSAVQALANKRQVSIDVSPSPVQVIPRQANSLALVLNELATNTLKHGLAHQGTILINVGINLEEQQMVYFEFRDSGPGYPQIVLNQAAAGSSPGVGLDLVQTIVRRELRGTLTLSNHDGALVIIRFPLARNTV